MPKLQSPDGRIVSVSAKGAEALKARGYTEPGGTATAAKASDGAPAKSANRSDWDDYARSQGLNPDDYSSKEELIDALDG